MEKLRRLNRYQKFILLFMQASFTVSEDQTVVFRYGDKTYDTYTVKEDPSAVPKNTELSEDLTGIELLCGHIRKWNRAR